MNWSSFPEFAAMGGYGAYVWGAFGLTAIVMIGELLSVRARRKAIASAFAREIEEEVEPRTHIAYREGAA